MPAAAAAAAAPARSGLHGSPAGWTENGLPVRVPQQSLAPPLREDPAPAMAADPATDAQSPSPDAARRVMSAFWQGRTRGLSEADHDQPNGAGRPEGGETR
jgi:hypothetical protein